MPKRTITANDKMQVGYRYTLEARTRPQLRPDSRPH